MLLLPLGVLWGGYTIIWYGLSLLHGPGLGIGDLVVPSKDRIDKCDKFFGTIYAPNLGASAKPIPGDTTGPRLPTAPGTFDPKQPNVPA